MAKAKPGKEVKEKKFIIPKKGDTYGRNNFKRPAYQYTVLETCNSVRKEGNKCDA